MAYTQEQVSAALNRAADDLDAALDLPDQGKRDLLNAMVNVGLHYLDWPSDDLTAALEGAYGDDAPSVLDWCST